MPSTNEFIRAAQVRHQVYLQRFSTGVVQRMLATLDRADVDLVRRIRARGPDGTWTTARLEKLLDGIRKMSAEGHAALRAGLAGELRAAGSYEVEFQRGVLVNGMGFDPGIVQPTGAAVYSATMARPLQGKFLRDLLTDMDVVKRRAIGEAIRLGVVEGESTRQIVNRVAGTKAAGFRDGVLAIHRRGAEAIVRTAVTHTMQQARNLLWAENGNLVKEWQFVATLDTRTTAICQFLDGKTYKVGRGPQPPRHVSCRSSTTPVLVSWRELGIDRDEIPAGTRASMNGQVPATQTYGEWLKGQPAGVQNEVLGVTRGRLLRSGGVSVDRFSDTAGRRYTLDELRSKDGAAFKAAGIDAK